MYFILPSDFCREHCPSVIFRSQKIYVTYLHKKTIIYEERARTFKLDNSGMNITAGHYDLPKTVRFIKQKKALNN